MWSDYMKDKTIFVVTVFEMCKEEDCNNKECYSINIGCTRSPCFKHTFEEAEEVVLNNIGDIRETCYDYAVIEEIDSKLYPRYITRRFYKYNKNTGGYETIEELDCIKHMLICEIG